MRRHSVFVHFVLRSSVPVLCAAAASAQTPLGTPWVPVGPTLATLEEIERSPLDPLLLVAAHDGQLVRSLDGGATWLDVPLGLTAPIRDIEFGVDGALVVGTGNTLHVSLDGGVTFVARPVPVPPNGALATLAVDPQDPARVWAGLGGAPRVLRSLDRGVTWADASPTVNFFSSCVAIDVDPTDSSRVIAVNENYYAHVTLDGGATWRDAGFVAAGDSARDVAFVGANLVLVTGSRALLSTDLGLSWSMLAAPAGTSGAFFFTSGTDVEVDRSVSGRVYIAGRTEGVYVSNDSGATWAIRAETNGLPAESLASGTQGVLLLASPSLGLIEASPGLVPRSIGTPTLAALGLARPARPLVLTSSPVAPQRLALVATDPVSSSNTRFLFLSSDGGASWALELGLGARPVSAQFAPDGRLFVGTGVAIGATTSPRALLRRDPQGWTPIGPTGVVGVSLELPGIAVSARQPAVVFVATVAYDPQPSGGEFTLRVQRSTDGGASWATVHSRVADTFAGRIQLMMTEGTPTRAVHLLDPGLEWIFSGFDSTVVSSTRDDGASWTARVLSEHQEAVSSSIALAPRNPGRIVVTDVRSNQALFQPSLQHSDDGGVTWVSTGPPLVEAQSNVGSNALPDVLFRATPSVIQRVEYAGEVAHVLDMAPFALGALAGVHVAGRPERVYALAADGLYAKDLPDLVGESACGPAVVNSSGAETGLLAVGSTSVVANTLTLRARRAPLSSVGLFLVSDQLGFVPGAGGSTGNLCLAGAIGRFGPNTVPSGTTGEFVRPVDLTALPRPTGPIAVLPGQTWSFQVWYRDTSAGLATSNFSDALTVTFTP